MRVRALISVLATAAALPLAAQSVDLTGAGATFAYPIYSRWISDFVGRTGIRINYQSIGSGGGIRQLTERTVDFGASDAPIADAELSRMPDRRIVHIPTVIGSVVAAYNLPSLHKKVRLSGALLADIYQGRVTKWNDARIAALNPGVSLPNRNIVVVYRADASGTTFVFTEYLAAVSPAWARVPGKGMSVSWPVGLGGRGNEGVAGQVRQIIGAIGYVELTYAMQNNLMFADLQNAAGNFVTATVASMTEAAAGAARTMASGDMRVSVVNAAGAGAYPITSYTWLLVDTRMPNAAKAKKLGDFVRYALGDGQKAASALHYAPLPAALVPQVLRLVEGFGR